jgi:hypothetical protein
MNRKLILISLCLLGLFANATLSFADSFTPDDVNAITLQNAGISPLVRVVESLGVDREADLPFTGAFDSHGWTWSLFGSYAGQSVAFSSTGTFDASTNTGSWTTIGTFGDHSLNSTGDVTFVPDTLSFQFAEISVIDFILPPITKDAIASSSYEERGSDMFKSTTTTQYSIGGVPVGKPVANSDDYKKNSSFDKELTAPDPFGEVTVRIEGTIADGTVAGRATVVPEPSTLLLFSFGLIALAALIWKLRTAPGTNAASSTQLVD